jgi:hypothetical protein
MKKFNTDDVFRENFLDDPVRHMEQLGWTTMTDDQKKELKEVASEIASQIRDSAKYKFTLEIANTTVVDTTVVLRPDLRI